MKAKKILRAVKSVLLSIFNMDYQMEFEKRKKAKQKGDFKPELNILEAFHCLALIEGQKENKNEKEK